MKDAGAEVATVDTENLPLRGGCDTRPAPADCNEPDSTQCAAVGTQAADLRPIAESPGYFVSRDGAVFSAPRRRMYWGGGWKSIAVIDGKVRLPTARDGGGTVYRRRSIAGLVRRALGGTGHDRD